MDTSQTADAMPAAVPAAVEAPRSVNPTVSHCRDCGAPISGNFCANCGQETRIRTPTVREFTHEMLDQYVAVEGKLTRTLRVLITRPGQLTADYLGGRRQRYVRPLKLYVSISVVFFGLLGLLPDSFSNPFLSPAGLPKAEQSGRGDAPPGTGNTDAAGARDAGSTSAKAPAEVPPPAQPAAPLASASENQELDLKAQIDRDIATAVKTGQAGQLGDTIQRHVDAEIKKSADAKKIQAEVHQKVKPGVLAAKLQDPKERERLRAKLLDDAPYAMFFLLPYFALLLRWLYRKNKLLYGAHLLFSVHLHCFAFLLLVLMLIPWEPWRQGMELVGAVYLFLALRRVYGGTWQRTLWRMGLLYAFYFVAVFATALSGVLGIVFGNGNT